MHDAEQIRNWGRGSLSPLVHLSNNWISLLGVVIVTTATVLWLFLLPTTIKGEAASPYIGILAFLRIPGPFFGGLFLIPLGIWLKRKREGRTHIYPPDFPTLAGTIANCGGWSTSSAATTVINIVIASQLSYGAVNYMDSVTFCGQTCHTVMQPEYTAYQNSPHSRVECVKCHIGPGAGWFVQAASSRASDSWSRSPSTPTRARFRPRSTICVPRARPAKPATGRRSTAKTACA